VALVQIPDDAGNPFVIVHADSLSPKAGRAYPVLAAIWFFAWQTGVAAGDECAASARVPNFNRKDTKLLPQKHIELKARLVSEFLVILCGKKGSRSNGLNLRPFARIRGLKSDPNY
jgi:hypothetical protein